MRPGLARSPLTADACPGGRAFPSGRWAFWALTLWLINVVMGASFRFVAYIMPDFETASACPPRQPEFISLTRDPLPVVASSPLFAVFVIFAGFLVLPRVMGTVVDGHPWMQVRAGWGGGGVMLS